MGYAFVVSGCFGCGRPFGYNPHRVPSHRDANGIRQPICKTCVEIANPIRVKNGLDPIVPYPDAYEPIDERDL